MPTEHFKTKEDYRKWNAYRHIHGIPAPHLKTAVVAGNRTASSTPKNAKKATEKPTGPCRKGHNR